MLVLEDELPNCGGPLLRRTDADEVLYDDPYMPVLLLIRAAGSVVELPVLDIDWTPWVGVSELDCKLWKWAGREFGGLGGPGELDGALW